MGDQEDAEEFLGFFFDTLEEELLSISTARKQKEEDAPSGDNGWLEVGKKNRLTTTRTVRSQPIALGS